MKIESLNKFTTAGVHFTLSSPLTSSEPQAVSLAEGEVGGGDKDIGNRSSWESLARSSSLLRHSRTGWEDGMEQEPLVCLLGLQLITFLTWN